MARRIYEHWTEASHECFERNCKCEGCFNEQLCADIERQHFFYDASNPYGIKQMKYAVLKLVEKLGKPKKKEVENDNTDND